MVESTLIPFKWNSKFSVDVAALDDDHQILFELLNHLRVTIKSGESSALPWIIDDIQQFAIYHFRHEESMMQACHYQYLDNHKLVHRMFESRLEDFINNSEYKENLQATRGLLGFMDNWLKDHIAGMDKNYSASMQSKEWVW